MRTPERRQHPRLSVAVAVDFKSTHNFYAGRTRDISLGGLFIESDIPLEIGAPITVNLTFLKKKATVEAEVAWQLVEHGRVVGVGVHFVHLSTQAKRGIQAFMALRKPMELDVISDPPPLEE